MGLRGTGGQWRVTAWSDRLRNKSSRESRLFFLVVLVFPPHPCEKSDAHTDEKDKENREGAKQQAKGFSKSSQAASRDESKAAAKAALDALKQYTRDQKNLADLGRRLQDEQELSDIYGITRRKSET